MDSNTVMSSGFPPGQRSSNVLLGCLLLKKSLTCDTAGRNSTGLQVQPNGDAHLLHSAHWRMQTVQKETCSWGRRPGRGPAQRCSGQSAGCSHSLRSSKRQYKRVNQTSFAWTLSDKPVWTTAPHLEFLQLLEDHVVRHVVKQPVSSREDDVTELDVKGRAVCCVGTARTHRGYSNQQERFMLNISIRCWINKVIRLCQ